jgi:hypothetical protein
VARNCESTRQTSQWFSLAHRDSVKNLCLVLSCLSMYGCVLPQTVAPAADLPRPVAPAPPPYSPVFGVPATPPRTAASSISPGDGTLGLQPLQLPQPLAPNDQHICAAAASIGGKPTPFLASSDQYICAPAASIEGKPTRLVASSDQHIRPAAASIEGKPTRLIEHSAGWLSDSGISSPSPEGGG